MNWHTHARVHVRTHTLTCAHTHTLTRVHTHAHAHAHVCLPTYRLESDRCPQVAYRPAAIVPLSVLSHRQKACPASPSTHTTLTLQIDQRSGSLQGISATKVIITRVSTLKPGKHPLFEIGVLSCEHPSQWIGF